MPLNIEDDMERNEPQTEGARERGFNVDAPSRSYGAADHDPDGAGDIADEGPGHRDSRVDDESRPTPGSAEGERDPREQSASNVPRQADSDRH